MATMLKDDGVREAFEFAIICVATSCPIVQVISKMVAKEKKLMTPVAKFVADQANNEVSETAQQSLLTATSSPPQPSCDSSSSEKE